MSGSLAIDIVLIFILILLNGYFAGAEIALISARKSALQEREENGSKGATRALRLAEDPNKLLATIQIGITLVGFLSSAVATATMSEPLAAWLRSLGLGWLASIAAPISIILITIIISYFTLVLGELVPKRLGLARSEAFAIFVSGPLSFIEKITSPIVWFLAKSTTAVSRLFGLKEDETGSSVSEEEIKMMVADQADLLDEEKRMIHEIFDVGDTVAREVMVPRVDAMLIEDTETIKRCVEIMRGTGYSRLPMFHEDHDRVVGIVLLKDLLEPIIDGEGDKPVADFARTPEFVPETKPILPLLTEMQTTRQQMVIVVDEYGGTAGLITTEDIVEEIVGEIADEYDPDNRYIMKVGENEYQLDGRLPIEDANRIGIPIEEDEDYETLAGWLLSELGKVPSAGEKLEWNGYTFTVVSMRRRRIARIRVVIPEEPQDESDKEPEDRDKPEEAL